MHTVPVLPNVDTVILERVNVVGRSIRALVDIENSLQCSSYILHIAVNNNIPTWYVISGGDEDTSYGFDIQLIGDIITVYAKHLEQNTVGVTVTVLSDAASNVSVTM